MRTNFDEQLSQLHRELADMGAMCESAISLAAKALSSGDGGLTEEVSQLTTQIDQKERDIEAMCMRLLLRQQPVATDLRVVSAALKMVTDMERIGDNSGDMAEIARTGRLTAVPDTLNLRDMATDAVKMVTNSVEAFIQNNRALAQAVIDYDDVVDRRFDGVKADLLRSLRHSETAGDYVVDLLMAAKYLERMADHAVNIARWVLYALTGEK